MAERADRDPTMEEIVVALRETRRHAGSPPLTLVGGLATAAWGSDTSRGGGQHHLARGSSANTRIGGASTDIADLRDAEIERLLAENARLNERVVFLLKVIEHEQAGNAAAGPEATDPQRGSIARDVRSALEAELRPVLLVLLRLLEKQRADTPDESARLAGLGTQRPDTPPADSRSLITRPDTPPALPPAADPKPDPTASGEQPTTNASANIVSPQQMLRQHLLRALNVLRL
jgi:hypothetical protein